MSNYSEIQRRFLQPTYGLCADQDKQSPRLRAGGLEQGAVVELYFSVEGSCLIDVRFRAYGSPTLIAFADAFCEALEGQPVSFLTDYELGAIQQQLQVPNTQIHVVMLFNELLHHLRQTLVPSTSYELR